MSKIEIIFIILDVLEIIITWILAKVLYKKYKRFQELSVMSLTFGSVLAVMHPKLFTILVILFVLLFVTICELSYKLHDITNRPILKKQKEVSVPYEIYHYEGQEVDKNETPSQDNDEKKEEA